MKNHADYRALPLSRRDRFFEKLLAPVHSVDFFGTCLSVTGAPKSFHAFENRLVDANNNASISTVLGKQIVAPGIYVHKLPLASCERGQEIFLHGKKHHSLSDRSVAQQERSISATISFNVGF